MKSNFTPERLKDRGVKRLNEIVKIPEVVSLIPTIDLLGSASMRAVAHLKHRAQTHY